MTDMGVSGGGESHVEVDHHEEIPQEASGSIAMIAFGLAVVLMLLAPFATRAQPEGKAWFVAPINAPMVALAIMAIPAAFLSWRWIAGYKVSENTGLYLLRARSAFDDFFFAAEFSIYFCIYLAAISYLGFAISTLLFGQWCLFRSGLRSKSWVLANFAFTAIVVIVLRVILGLWFPMAPIFKLLPSSIGNALGSIL